MEQTGSPVTQDDPVRAATSAPDPVGDGGTMASIVSMWLRLELARRWRALLVLGLLVGLTTATVLTSVAGARRGASAVERLLAVTLPGTAVVVPNQPAFDWERVRALPEVAALTRFPAYAGLTILEAPNDDVTALLPADSDAMRTIEAPVLLAAGSPIPPAPTKWSSPRPS